MVSLSTQILTLVIMRLSFISVSILCKFATLPDVYILVSPTCTHLTANSSKKIKPFVIILVCVSNTEKNKTAKQIASSLVLVVYTFDSY